MVFDNHCVNVIGEVAIAMGNYYFTSCADGSKTKVEYTFGYSKNSDGKEGGSKNASFAVRFCRWVLQGTPGHMKT